MDCREVRNKIYHLLEVVAPNRERYELACHLQDCNDCRLALLKEFQWEIKVRKKIEEDSPKTQVTPLLKSILARIEVERERERDGRRNLSGESSIVCPGCDFCWEGEEEFARDNSLRVIEFHSNILSPGKSKILFKHRGECEIVLYTCKFRSLREEESCRDILFLQESCQWSCLYPDNTEVCDSQCRVAEERKVLSLFNKKE